jgi:hypothetical protein
VFAKDDRFQNASMIRFKTNAHRKKIASATPTAASRKANLHLVGEFDLAGRGSAGGSGKAELFSFSCADGRFRLRAHSSSSAREA